MWFHWFKPLKELFALNTLMPLHYFWTGSNPFKLHTHTPLCSLGYRFLLIPQRYKVRGVLTSIFYKSYIYRYIYVPLRPTVHDPKNTLQLLLLTVNRAPLKIGFFSFTILYVLLGYHPSDNACTCVGPFRTFVSEIVPWNDHHDKEWLKLIHSGGRQRN